MRCRYEHVELVLERHQQSTFMIGIRVGVEQTDGHRIRVEPPHLIYQLAHGLLAQRLEHSALRINPLGNSKASLCGDQWRRLLNIQVVDIASCLSANLQYVFEPARCDEHDFGATSLQQRIRRHGRTMYDVDCFTVE